VSITRSIEQLCATFDISYTERWSQDFEPFRLLEGDPAEVLLGAEAVPPADALQRLLTQPLLSSSGAAVSSIRQAARGIRRFFDTADETLHNVVGPGHEP
jgi:hypothetical protein